MATWSRDPEQIEIRFQVISGTLDLDHAESQSIEKIYIWQNFRWSDRIHVYEQASISYWTGW